MALGSIAAAPVTASAQSFRDPFTGFYIGGNIGGVFARGALDGVPVDPLKPHGAFGGVQAGYDFRLTDRVVLGALADIDFGSAKDTVYDGPNLHYGAKIDRLGTFRARLGYVVNDWLMPYVTGGGAFAHATGSIGCPAGAPFGVCALTGPFNASTSQTNWGWVAGIGAKIALWGNWSTSVEYLYADFGSPTTSVTTPFGAVSGKTDQSLQWVKLSLDYRF
jgi:outer membrane immunogenic protein